MNLDEVLNLIDREPPKDVKDLKLLKSTLIELREMIGNADTKDQIAKYVHLIINKQRKGEDITSMLNTIIYGSPGVGKTKIGCKLAAIWYSLGFLKIEDKKTAEGDLTAIDLQRNEYVMSFIIVMTILMLIWTPLQFVVQYLPYWILIVIGFIFFLGIIFIFWGNRQSTKPTNMNSSAPDHRDVVQVVSREDFIDQYMGWTEKKTLSLLKNNRGKVLFIDEAYSLYSGHYDQYGMEAATVINRYLSEHPGEIIVIFAGYRKNLEDGLFKIQPGLPRRCMFHLEVADYTADELFEIFHSQIKGKGYNILDIEGTKLCFQENYDAFPSFGGDCERFVDFCLMEQCLEDSDGKSISLEQIQRAIKTLKKNNISKGSPSSKTIDLMDLYSQIRPQVTG